MRRGFFLTLLVLFLVSTPHVFAQQYKCAYDSDDIDNPCKPCTSYADMGSCQSSMGITDLCNEGGLNTCIAHPPPGGCADTGGQLNNQPVQSCPIATPTPDPTVPTPTPDPLVSPTPTPIPTILDCNLLDNATDDWSCVSVSDAIPGNYFCNPPGYPPKPQTNPYDNHCTALLSSPYWCCKHVVGCGPLGGTCPTPEPQGLCTPPNADPITGYHTGVNTPFGCLPFTGGSGPAKVTIETLSNWAVVISGTIAIFIILFASLQIATATGDPKRLKAGQELLFSGLAGLFLIGIAITLLNFLGVTILGLNLLGFIL